MLGPLSAERAIDARAAAAWPHIKDSSRRAQQRRLSRLASDGTPVRARKATAADLAPMGIRIVKDEADG